MRRSSETHRGLQRIGMGPALSCCSLRRLTPLDLPTVRRRWYPPVHSCPPFVPQAWSSSQRPYSAPTPLIHPSEAAPASMVSRHPLCWVISVGCSRGGVWSGPADARLVRLRPPPCLPRPGLASVALKRMAQTSVPDRALWACHIAPAQTQQKKLPALLLARARVISRAHEAVGTPGRSSPLTWGETWEVAAGEFFGAVLVMMMVSGCLDHSPVYGRGVVAP